MSQFLGGDFVETHTLNFRSCRRFDENLNFIPQIQLKGEIACCGMILLTVDKYLDILYGSGDSAVVQTVSYAYNVSVQGLGNIFRYDDQDDYFMINSGHADKHHKHVFDWHNKDQVGSVVWQGYEKWPQLDQVIREAEDWYWNNRSSLHCPTQYAQIGKRDCSHH